MGDHVCQFPLALFAGGGIDGFYVPRAVGEAGGVFAFVTVLADLGDAAGAGLAAEALVGVEGRGGLFRLWGGHGGGGAGDGAVDGCGGLLAHGVGDVGVDVQRRGHAVVADDGGEGFDIHARLQRQRGECMAQVVEA